jgi:hypothetical protein
MAADKASKENPVDSKLVLELVAVAHDFCSSLDKAEEYPRSKLLTYLQRILPLVYIRAALLPAPEVRDEGAIEHYVTEEQWEELFNRLREKFGEQDLYYYIDPLEKINQDAVRASLSENLADIYQDLKDFLLLYQNPLVTFRENAVADCKRLFETRFGYRIVNSLSALHTLIYGSQEQAGEELPDLF